MKIRIIPSLLLTVAPFMTVAAADGITVGAFPDHSPDMMLRTQVSGSVKSVRHISRSQAKVPLQSIVGKYISRDFSFFNPEREANACIEILQRNDSVIVSNLYRLGVDLKAEWDEASSTLTIAPQKIYDHPDYGVCTVNTWTPGVSMPVFDETAPIVISANADGTLSMSPWGIFVASGDRKGSTFESYTASTLCRPNATMSTRTYGSSDDPQEYPVLISQDNEGSLSLGNLLNNGVGFNVQLNPDKTAWITPQYVMSQAIYGDFWLYAAKINTSKGTLDIDKTNFIGLTPGEGKISLSPWGVYCIRSTSIAAANGAESVLLTDFVVSYPEASAALQGEGTQESPYRVATADDLRTLALSVTADNNYQGKHVALTADIDLSAWQGRWYPVGGIGENPFEGSFHGGGHTISGLKTNFYGAKYSGIFGLVGASGSVSDLKVTGFEYQGSGANIGGVVGYTRGEIRNVEAAGSIDCTSVEIGGVVGYASAPVKGCSFKGSLTGGVDIGGVVGYSTSSVSDCHADASIVLKTYIPNGYGTHASGGVVAAMYGTAKAPVSARNCYFSGSITDLQNVNQQGGVVGAMYNGTISRCFNVGRITSYAGAGTDGNSPTAGGVLGYASATSIDNSYNAGAINAPANDFAAGIVGYCGGFSNAVHDLRSCYNSGMINGASKFDRAAFAGGYFKSALFEIYDCCFDRQTTGLEFGSQGDRSTEEMTSGTALPGFSTDDWVFEKGLYPRLKGFETTDAALLSAAPLLLTDGESIKKIKKNFGVSTSNGVQWGFLQDDGSLADSCDGMSIAGTEVTLNNVYSLESIVARSAEGAIKHFILRVVPDVYKGSGTADDPYLISSRQDLITLQNAVNIYLQSHKGDCFLQTADIDLRGDAAFAGIGADGSASHYFGGTYDGGGHYIHNFHLKAAKVGPDGNLDSGSTHPYAGFFGICTETSVVRNVRIASDCSFEFYRYSAPVVGYTLGRVENCRNYAPVKSYSMYNGGIVGAAIESASVAGCLNVGNIGSFDGSVGGIVGYSEVSVADCQNIGSIRLVTQAPFSTGTGTKNVGGIVGMNFGSVDGCVNGGYVEGITGVGGIVGTNSISPTTRSGGDVTGSLGYGIVCSSSGDPTASAIVGNMASFGRVADNYYDSQICVGGGASGTDAGGIAQMSTSALVDGSAAGTLDKDRYRCVAGSYPVLAAFADDEYVKANAASVLLLDPVDVRDGIENSADILLPSGARAWMLDGKAFRIEGARLIPDLAGADQAVDTICYSGPFGTKSMALRAVAPLFRGKGTGDDPHIIASKDDMRRLADAVNNGKRSYAGHNFRLTADLDYKDDTYTMVADGTGASFRGTFDGNGKTISGVTIGGSNDKTSFYTGLFGHVGPGGRIADLTVGAGVFSAWQYAGTVVGELAGELVRCVSLSDVNAGNGYAGGLAGVMRDGSSAIDCVNKGSVSLTAGSYAGGMTSVCYGLMSGCVNEGDVISYGGYGGGLAGSLRGTALRCSNKGLVMLSKANNYLGGIAGVVEPGVRIIESVNTGNVSGGKNYVGGIYGGSVQTASMLKADGGLIEDCSNMADISSTGTNIGGISGCMAPGQTVLRCVNSGKVTASGNYAAGIVGEMKGSDDFDSYIAECLNLGKVDQTAVANKQYVGGIIGRGVSGRNRLENCVNKGEIASEGYFVGGIAGNFNFTLSGCVNTGFVHGATYAIGGIAGYGGSSSVVEGCVNGGEVKATGTSTKTYGTAAGILGYGYTRVVNCANFGAVGGNDYLAGIAGTGFSGISVDSCYNVGEITCAEGAVNVGNIYSAAVAIGTGNYAMGPSLPSDSKVGVIVVDEKALMDLDLGKGFLSAPASWPVPVSAALIPEARFHTVRYRLADGDTPDNVQSDFLVGIADGIEWSVSDSGLAAISDGKVEIYPASGKKLTLECSDGDRTKCFDFIVKKQAGVDTVEVREIAERSYFTLDGIRLYNPEKGSVCVVVTRYADGTVETEKAVVR